MRDQSIFRIFGIKFSLLAMKYAYWYGKVCILSLLRKYIIHGNYSNWKCYMKSEH